VEEIIGTLIEHFRVTDILGKGGMGSVYVAYDEKLQRNVALKALRSDFRRHPEARTRFIREARVLSKLDHPNICRIFSIIEQAESDYLILELIQGKTLKDLLTKPLDMNMQLRIARELLEVLAVAHEKGVIHRDLKPANLMVTDEGDLKVLDFGLARSIELEELTPLPDEETELEEISPLPEDDGPMPELRVTGPSTDQDTSVDLPEGQEKLLSPVGDDYQTAFGAILGTLGYMSPEQARGEQVSSASDIYSAGLILQELFTGKPAQAGGGDALARLVSTAKGETVDITGIDPDLASLVDRMKSLAPASRPTALDAAERLHFIMTKPERRRRKILQSVAVSILVIMVLVMAGLSFRLDKEVKRVAQALQETKEVSDYLVEIFKITDPYAVEAKNPSVNDILDLGTREAQTRFQTQPLTRARFLEVFGNIYTNLGQYQRAKPMLQEAVKLRTDHMPAGHPDIAASLNKLADVLQHETRYTEAEELFTRALAIREQKLGLEHLDVAETLNDLAENHYYKGNYDQGEPLFLRALAIKEKVLGADHPQVADILNNLALLYSDQGKYEQSKPLFLRALMINEKTLGPDHPQVAATLHNLAYLYYDQAMYEQSEPLFKRALAIKEKALGPDHHQLATTVHNLGLLYADQGKYNLSEPLLLRALSIEEKTLGPDHPQVATALHNLAVFYADQGKYEQSEPFFLRSLAIDEKTMGPDHPQVAITLSRLAWLYVKMKKFDKAESLGMRALAIEENSPDAEPLFLARTLYRMACLKRETKKFEESEQLFKRSLTIFQKNPGASVPYYNEALSEYAQLLRFLKRLDEAVRFEALAISRNQPN